MLVQQKGLLTARQAAVFGVAPAMVHRRCSGERPEWRRVLPRVYATFRHPLTSQQQAIAAWLYAGRGAVLTGAAALHWWGVAYLPREVQSTPVDVLLPIERECASTRFVRVTRTRRPISRINVDHVACVPIARAVVDCGRRLGSYEPVLGLVSSVLNGRRATLDELASELAAGTTRGSRHLRQVLLQAATNVRSVPEGRLLALLAGTTLPAPLVNVPIIVDGHTYVPDLRWGWFIVEVDSRLHHLLVLGAWEATQRRRFALQRAGYHVLPVTPEQITLDPVGVVETIIADYLRYAAA